MDGCFAWGRTFSLGILGPAILLAGCSEPQQQAEQTIVEAPKSCSGKPVPNSYMVHWVNGEVTVLDDLPRQKLIDEVIKPNLADIHFVEQDQVIAPPKEVASIKLLMAETPSPEKPDSNWAVKKVASEPVWAQNVLGDGVIVAVIDSGVDTLHPFLKDQIYKNSAEIPGNGIDDDGNGYVDDVQGWDFVNNVGAVTDTHGHGTHVSGIIAAKDDKNRVQGVAPGARVMPLAFMSDGGGKLSDAIKAIEYATNNGAKVINASWGEAPCSPSLQNAIQAAGNKGVLFVAAAGNDGLSLDNSPTYPAAYDLATQLTVGASTARDLMASYSNFSFNRVHLFAPGDEIVSTYPTTRDSQGTVVTRLAVLSGTSMASPFVAAAAALLWSARPNATLDQIRAAIMAGVDPGGFASVSRGRLNLERSLEKL